MRGTGTIAVFLSVLLGCAFGQTTSDWPQLRFIKALSGLTLPVYATHAGDGSGRLFIVEQGGRIRIAKDGALLSQPFLDIQSRVSCCGERGLLSVAFPPGYSSKGHFYVNYTNTAGNTVVARYRITSNPDVADPASETILLTINQPYSNHNGGQLAFGPRDGYLYIGMGDGGSGGDPQNNAQTRSALLGKMLRIDVESGAAPYAIPPSNPFLNDAAYRQEIWATGVRNPWRFSFDRETGDLYIADVGQDKYEEVDFQPAASVGGENYGWNVTEGLHCYLQTTCSTTGFTPPVAEYDHASGGCSVSGGFVYRGTRWPAAKGIYFYGDYCNGKVWGLRRAASQWQSNLLSTTGYSISSFGEDQDGELYVANYATGDIYLLAAGTPAVAAGGVVNAASGVGGLVPGGIASLFGSGLTRASGIVSASSTPLPVQLAGTSVSVNGTKVPLLAIAYVNGIEQINFQAPFELLAPGTAKLVVTNNGIDSAAADEAVFAAQPGVFTMDGTQGAIVHGADNRLVSPASPAAPNEIVVLYGTSFGAVAPMPGTGAAAGASLPSKTLAVPEVRVSGRAAEVFFSGLSPGSVGLYQINFRVPVDAPSGAADVVVIISGASSVPVKMSVR
jgi:uncharacterized protein (TIGR03437 family)